MSYTYLCGLCAIYSQGGVKFPTGGDFYNRKARERLPNIAGSSRSGEIPEPTVTVRKGEDSTVERYRNAASLVRLCVHTAVLCSCTPWFW